MKRVREIYLNSCVGCLGRVSGVVDYDKCKQLYKDSGLEFSGKEGCFGSIFIKDDTLKDLKDKMTKLQTYLEYERKTTKEKQEKLLEEIWQVNKKIVEELRK